MKPGFVCLVGICISTVTFMLASVSAGHEVTFIELSRLHGTAPCYVTATGTCPSNNGSCTVACNLDPLTCPKENDKEKSQIQATFPNTADTPSDPGHVSRTPLSLINCTKVTTCTGCVKNAFGNFVCDDGASTQEDSRTPYNVDTTSATCNDS